MKKGTVKNIVKVEMINGKKIEIPVWDELTGKDRYPGSTARGFLVCPIIYLWDSPEHINDETYLTGALPHKTPVKVCELVMFNDEYWARVEKTIKHNGQDFPQEGFIKAVLLKDIGRKVINELYKKSN